MNSPMTHPTFEEELRAALAVPGMSPDFRQALGRRLRVAAMQRRATWPARLSWRPVAALLLAGLMLAVLLIGPRQVWAQVLDWLRYIPGVGYVETEGGLRVLEEAVSVEREGITLTVQQGLVDDEQTHLTILFEGIQPEQWPGSEAIVGCFDRPILELADGSQLAALGGGGGSGRTWWQDQSVFPAIPADVHQVELLIGCVWGTLEGSAPKDWRVPLNFVPAAEDFESLPVVPLPTESGEGSEADNSGIHLSVDQMVALDDGYLFQLHLTWDNADYEQVRINEFDLLLTDANGDRLPYELVSNETPPGDTENWIWSLRLQGQQLASPLSFRLDQVTIPLWPAEGQRPAVEVDLGEAPLDGQVWELNQSLDYAGYSTQVKQISFQDRGDGYTALQLEVHFDPQQIASPVFFDPDNQSNSGFGGGGGGGEDAGMRIQTLSYDYVPTGLRRLELAGLDVILEGSWEASVNLPETGSSDETSSAPEACITQADYLSLVAAAEPLPSELGGDVLWQDFSNGEPLPRLTLSALDSNEAESIDIGAWSTLSPDGRYLAYAHNGLQILELESGQNLLSAEGLNAYTMRWAPDSSRLAFIEAGEGLYLINTDGSDLQPVAGSSADMTHIAGWMPDGQRLVVTAITPDGSLVQSINVDSGEVMDHFLIDNRKGGFARLSPDGTRIAYSQLAFGGPTYSVYVANLDGSQEELLAESGTEAAFQTGAWSADSQWLLLSVSRLRDSSTPYNAPLLVNLDSCQAYILEGMNGEITGWAP